jgi:hypothetical protein
MGENAMKVTIDIDCTPVEARKFLGLPDVEAFQAEMMRQMQEKLTKGLTPEDMDNFMKTWTPIAGQGWENMQKLFWGAATGKDNK